MWITIRDFLLPPDMLAMRTAGPNWNHSKLYGSFAALWFFLMEKDESEKVNLSLLLNGSVYAVIFVNDSAIMNQKDVKIIIMKSLHSLDTATIPTYDLDTSCAAVMIGVSSQMECAKRTQ